MFAHADKTLHRKIYSINDIDTFSLYPFFKIVYSLMNPCTNSSFVYEFVKDFSRTSYTNLCMKRKFIQVHMKFLHEKLVMLRMACTVCMEQNGLFSFIFSPSPRPGTSK